MPSLSRRAWCALVATTLVLAALVALTVTLAARRGAESAADARDRIAREALTAARREVLTLTTLTPATAERQVQRLLAGATGSFRAKLRTIATPLAAAVVRTRTSTQGRVRAAGVVDVDRASGRVVLLVAAEQQFAGDTPPRPYRLRMTMTRSGDAVLVANMVVVQ